MSESKRNWIAGRSKRKKKAEEKAIKAEAWKIKEEIKRGLPEFECFECPCGEAAEFPEGAEPPFPICGACGSAGYYC